MSPLLTFENAPTPQEREDADREATGRVRCIGCGRFVREDAHWNQCPDCREPEER